MTTIFDFETTKKRLKSELFIYDKFVGIWTFFLYLQLRQILTKLNYNWQKKICKYTGVMMVEFAFRIFQCYETQIVGL